MLLLLFLRSVLIFLSQDTYSEHLSFFLRSLARKEWVSTQKHLIQTLSIMEKELAICVVFRRTKMDEDATVFGLFFYYYILQHDFPSKSIFSPLPGGNFRIKNKDTIIVRYVCWCFLLKK